MLWSEVYYLASGFIDRFQEIVYCITANAAYYYETITNRFSLETWAESMF